MNRHLGAESFMGIGGGTVSKEATKNLEIAEELCRKKKPKQALPYLMKALEDPHNLDAGIQFAALLEYDESIALLDQVERKGRELLKREIAPDVFDEGSEHVGRFWLMIQTRPYMRVLKARSEYCYYSGRYEESADIMIEMLRLRPEDNQGVRDWLCSALIQVSFGPGVQGKPKYTLEDALYFAQEWIDPKRRDGSAPPRGGCGFALPDVDSASHVRKDALPEREVKLLEKDYAFHQIYTAALAVFLLWGNTTLARQYLRAAAHANPTVLIKILAKVDSPSHLRKSQLRSMNGSDSAQDYLYLIQERWMQPDVWNWANSVTEAKIPLYKYCSRNECRKKEERILQYKKCSACKSAWYCGPECQKADWAAHKKSCKDVQQQALLYKMMGRK